MSISTKLRAFFEPLQGESNKASIYAWWEKRRFDYNVLMCATTVISIIAYIFFWSTSGLLSDIDDIVEPMLWPVIVVGFPIAWNICFFVGPIAQNLVPISRASARRSAGPLLLKVGIAFSLFVLLLPTLDAACAWLWQASRGFPHTEEFSLYREKTPKP